MLGRPFDADIPDEETRLTNVAMFQLYTYTWEWLVGAGHRWALAFRAMGLT
jgi:hypothetical protein